MTSTTFEGSDYDRVLRDFADKPQAGKSGRFRRFWFEANTLSRMARAWKRGDYELTTPQIAMIFGALAYVVMPADAVPDPIVGLGLADDAAVVASLMAALAVEIASFRSWEAQQDQHRSAV